MSCLLLAYICTGEHKDETQYQLSEWANNLKMPFLSKHKLCKGQQRWETLDCWYHGIIYMPVMSTISGNLSVSPEQLWPTPILVSGSIFQSYNGLIISILLEPPLRIKEAR